MKNRDWERPQERKDFLEEVLIVVPEASHRS